MAKAIVQHHIGDYAKWYPVFTDHEANRRKHGATGHVVNREVKDPNTIIVVTEFGTAEGARAFTEDPSLKDAMARAGVDGIPQVWVVDEAESKRYSSSDSLAAVRHLYEVINANKLDAFAKLLSDDFVEHQALPNLPPTKEGTLTFFKALRVAFPDMHMRLDDCFVAGDKAAARVTWTGTQKGPFMEMPATGKSARVELIDLFQLDSRNHLRAHWGILDTPSLMQQLGHAPAATPAPAPAHAPARAHASRWRS